MQRLDPKQDIVFKLLLTREPSLLVDMLQGILDRTIHELDVLNPNIPGELSGDKQIALDIRAVLDDGSRVDVEMQMRSLPALSSRLVYYAARDYADQLRKGDEYHLLTPTAGIVWLVEPLFPALDRLHSIFELRERHTHAFFGDQIAIHLLQLSALSSLPSEVTDNGARVQRWARFLAANDDETLERLATEDPIMSTAKQTLEQLSLDPAIRRLVREREDSAKLYRMHLAASRAEGQAEGEARGKAIGEARGKARGRAELLLELVGLRFGPLPEAIRARVEAARPEQVDTWAERVLTAETLDDVFGD